MANSFELEDRISDASGESSAQGEGAQEEGKESIDPSIRMARHGRPKSWHRSRTRSILVVLWTVFTVCLGIMIIVILVQPQWLGGTNPKNGVVVNFGLFRNCTESWRMCPSKISNFGHLPKAWQAATLLVMFAVCSTLVSLIIMAIYWLRCRETAGFGFRYATGLQIATGCFLFLTCLIYPSGWDAPAIRSICGQSAGKYKPGSCEVKWAYGISIISMLDAFILATLSFFFIERRVVAKPLVPIRRPSVGYQVNGNLPPASPIITKPDELHVEEDNTQL